MKVSKGRAEHVGMGRMLTSMLPRGDAMWSLTIELVSGTDIVQREAKDVA